MRASRWMLVGMLGCGGAPAQTTTAITPTPTASSNVAVTNTCDPPPCTAPAPVANACETPPCAAVVATNDQPTHATGDPCEGGEVTDQKLAGGGIGGGRSRSSRAGLVGLGGGGGDGETGGGASSDSRTAVLTPGTATVAGNSDPAAVRRVLSSYTAAYRSCYQRDLHRDPSISGRVDLELTIEPTGKVGDANASGVSTPVDDCIVRITKRLEFPKPAHGGSTDVTYPLVFKNE